MHVYDLTGINNKVSNIASVLIYIFFIAVIESLSVFPTVSIG